MIFVEGGKCKRGGGKYNVAKNICFCVFLIGGENVRCRGENMKRLLRAGRRNMSENCLRE